ncbi:MAG: peptidoglycan-associated lipoprotein Pal [Sumerlaeia bacterium]
MFRSPITLTRLPLVAAVLVLVAVSATGCSKKKSKMTAHPEHNPPVNSLIEEDIAPVEVTYEPAAETSAPRRNAWSPDGAPPASGNGIQVVASTSDGGLDAMSTDEATGSILNNADTSNVGAAMEIADLEMVHFEYDQADIKPEWQQTLDRHATWLGSNPFVHVQVEGHCDERGTEEYNIALGQRRADTVREYLVGQGVAPERISTISYGKMRPLTFEGGEQGHNLNRRAMFLVYEPAPETAAAY